MEDTLDTGIRSEGLVIDRLGQDYIKETAKWAKILAIIGLVFCALMVLLSFFMGTFMAMMPGTEGMPGGMGVMLSVIYLLMAALYAYPIWQILQFSNKSKRAIVNQDSGLLTESLGALKSAYKFIGILMLIILGLYGVMFLVGILGAGAAAIM